MGEPAHPHHIVIERRSRPRTAACAGSRRASYAFIEHSQTNGVAERFVRPREVQIVRSRVYRTVAELREAVETFVDLFNERWLPERNGLVSPSASRTYETARCALL